MGRLQRGIVTIPAELLNNQLIAREVHTGVYQNKQRRVAIVVRVSKEGKVAYLTLTDTCRIEVQVSFAEKFLADFPLELYHYPVMRAVRRYAGYVRKEHIPISDEARKVINSILVRN